MPPRPPAGRLAAIWFLYLAGMGAVFPFQALYFRENLALGGAQLGVLLGVRPLMGMLFQGAWGQLADRTGSRIHVFAWILVGNALAYALLPFARAYPALIAGMAFASLFGTSFFPLATSISMAALGPRPTERFGGVRVWGTIGFLAMVVSFPLVLDWIHGEPVATSGAGEPGLEGIFWAAAVLTLAAAGVVASLPREGAVALRASRGDLRMLLRHGPYLRLLAFTFLAYFFLQGPILLFPMLVRAHGGDLETLSRLWVPMLALEIPLVFLTGHTLRRIGARGLLAIGVLADGLRWLGCVWIGELSAFYVLQLLHGVVVAGLVVGGPLYVEQVVPERLRSTGQGVMGMLGISMAGMLSSVAGGLLLEHRGPEAPYWFGGCGALLLGASIPWLLPRPSRPAPAEDPGENGPSIG